ncbi:putative short chain dehydrogenase/reductase [Poronia punctata]|nr:putative short chain dehydrogenase/reductase [Poronia punctata]
MSADKTVILITGANSGIGLETVKALAATSSNFHILLGSRSTEKGQQALDEISASLGESQKGTISVIELDVCNQATIDAARAKIEQDFGKLDILINNAGVIIYQQVDAITSLRQTFDANVFGPVLLTDALEGLLRKSAKPYIIHVSSQQGSITSRLDPNDLHRDVRGDHYRMSKSALNMLAACHRYNFAEWGCKVLSFNPGFCVSNLTGEKGRQMRIDLGARDPKDPANALVDVVLGKRDADIEKNGMVDLDGGILPW